MEEKGLLHLYCGNGKGKTTAAMGLALRCIGHGRPVVVAQFLKDGSSGECSVLRTLPGVTLLAANPCGKFSYQMNDAERTETACAVTTMFWDAVRTAEETQARLLVLDEACAAVSGGFLDKKLLLEFLDERPAGLEVVLTGRNPCPELQERADYFSEIICHKHPYQAGIPAREDIES